MIPSDKAPVILECNMRQWITWHGPMNTLVVKADWPLHSQDVTRFLTQLKIQLKPSSEDPHAALIEQHQEFVRQLCRYVEDECEAQGLHVSWRFVADECAFAKNAMMSYDSSSDMRSENSDGGAVTSLPDARPLNLLMGSVARHVSLVAIHACVRSPCWSSSALLRCSRWSERLRPPLTATSSSSTAIMLSSDGALSMEIVRIGQDLPRIIAKAKVSMKYAGRDRTCWHARRTFDEHSRTRLSLCTRDLGAQWSRTSRTCRTSSFDLAAYFVKGIGVLKRIHRFPTLRILSYRWRLMVFAFVIALELELVTVCRYSSTSLTWEMRCLFGGYRVMHVRRVIAIFVERLRRTWRNLQRIGSTSALYNSCRPATRTQRR